MKTFKSFGSLDCEEYDELESVIDWLLDVINFNLFVNCVSNDNLADWDETQNVILPHHLFTNKPRDFWLGIYTILAAMTKRCIQTSLLTSDLSHKELLELVLALLCNDPDKEYNISNFCSHLESNKCTNTVFWPVLQCFVLLVDKLGSRFWMITRASPNSVLKLLKSNPYYQLQLKICYNQAARLDASCDNDFTFSQLVYDDCLNKADKSLEPLQEPYHGFSLSWAVPFIKSLFDFGDYESSTIVELLGFICHIHSVSLHGDTNVSSTDLYQTVLPIEVVAERVDSLFLPQETLKCISQSVDVLFSQKVYSVLLQCKQAVFCMINVLCSHVLSRRKKPQQKSNQIKQYLSQTARTYTSLVMYCSTEKTASKLWYLVNQIKSLSPFLSIISSQADSAHNHTDLLQPDELSETLVKMIADKESNQEIAGPFLYPPSFSPMKKGTSTMSMIKQESMGEETNKDPPYTTIIKQEPLLDQDLCHQESSSNSEDSFIVEQQLASTDISTNSDTSNGPNQKQISLKLKKLPITVFKSDKGNLQYEFKGYSSNSATESSEVTYKAYSESCEPTKSQIESDTDSCSTNSDDDDDELPSYLYKRFTNVSTSSTVTIESECNKQLNVQKTVPKEEIKVLVKDTQVLSQRAQIKRSDDNINSRTESIICSTKNVDVFGPHSKCYTPTQSSSKCLLQDCVIEKKTEGCLKHDTKTTSADQEWTNDNELNSDCAGVSKSSTIIDMVLPECDPHLSKASTVEDSAFDDQCTSKLRTLTKEQKSVGSEVGSLECIYLDSDDEDVFSAADQHTYEHPVDNQHMCEHAVDNQHACKLASLAEEQHSLNSKISIGTGVVEDVNVELMQYENTQTAKSYEADDNFVVAPNKHCNLKFKSKAVVLETDIESSGEISDQNSCKANPSSIPDFQKPAATSTQQMISDKVQPAVAGRAPFSKSRMASLHENTPNAQSTRVQTGKAKDNVTSKDLHKKAPKPLAMDQSSAITTKVVVKVDLSRNRSKEEFLMEVLSWDPTAFYHSKEKVNSTINEGPYSLPNIEKVPVTFESSDQYIEVFKPLLQLETWDMVSLCSRNYDIRTV